MDASASRRVDADINKVYGLFLQIENTSFSSPFQQNNTVIKYTKLPDFDFDSKVSWPEKSYSLQPRLRRIISLGDCDVLTSRSLKPALVAPLKTMSSTITRRKIVTIAEDDESDLHPKFSKERKSSRLEKTSNKSVETDYKSEKQFSQRTTSRLTNPNKYSKETKPSAKNNNLNNKKEVTPTKPIYRNKYSNFNQPSSDSVRMRNFKDKDLIRPRSSNAPIKLSISKNFVTQRESEKELSTVKNKVSDPLKSNTAYKKTLDRPRLSKVSTQGGKNSTPFLKEIQSKNKPVTIIHVPLDNYHEVEVKDDVSQNTLVLPLIEDSKNKADCGTEVEKDLFAKHASTETKAVAETADKVTQSDCESEIMFKSVENANVQVDLVKEAFDSLHIPNVTLTKDRKESKESSVSFYSKSLPNLQVTSLKFSPQKDGYNTEDSDIYKSSSYVIGHATVTCTTKQKINIHVVGNSAEETTSYQSPSPLAYPISVVSIYEKEIKKKQVRGAYEQEHESKAQYTNCLNELKSLNCSYVLNSNKLVKPSDIISTMRVNNGLLHSEYICEQFERELNFIDSFFESLQYLENSSLSEKCFTENKGWIKTTEYDEKNSDYGRFLSKLENGANVDDTETMASKSLCLLNLLIRDEQRRAKNLLFVLKMREDALKDFTKSQILWLENKKKQDNTDISTLKKKQRGALLKLQHECGEMQRMRKALVTQSEKRKVVLMKTKKNIELKLKNSVDVDQILLGKKKLKRNTNDRNTAPLKCFDLLTSSGCDESLASRSKADIPLPDVSATVTSVSSAEKCIQTGESILGSLLIDQSTDTAAENFVVVDGGYLNILFRNLSMPQIFSSGKNYEVNEEALRNILSSAHTNHSINEADVLDRLMNQIKNPDLEISTPSTARSLVEEMDQYYKGLIDGEKSPRECSVRDLNISEVKDTVVQAVESNLQQVDSHSFQTASTMTSGSSETLMDQCLWEASGEVECSSDKEGVVPQAGPLPVPAGEASSGAESAASDVPLWALTKSPSSSTSECSSVSSQPLCQSASSLSSMSVPICEAEELRRQQLAIEREIKALEQQQCQLLVVREIPDKPPPPYTPPVDARSPCPPRMYVADETTEEKIQRYVRDPESEDHDPTDAFDTFVKDFCIETIERQKSERTEMPWDSCNLLPHKPQEDAEKVIKTTSSHLLEILTGVVPTVVSGVSGRRSDHIDDILFAEWRRCEPEWTSLHSDEALVKNQIFESIFQKILTETVDEYKRTVLCNK